MTRNRWIALLAVATLLVLPTGCGCGSDSGGFTPITTANVAAAALGAQIPPVAIPLQPVQPVVKVDVLFLQDDSESFTSSDPTIAGILGENPPRLKKAAAQAAFRHIANNLDARLQAEFPQEDFDVAFGYARYEDYAGFVRNGLTSTQPQVQRPPVDDASRPFILSQPILRRGRADFTLNFEAGLARETPGLAGRNPYDANTALEALYQAATGAGYDGQDVDPGTDGSGIAGDINAQLNPGASGDVPAPSFVDVGTDGDGEPAFTVGDLQASGNVGGAGWRPDSVRFIITSSDIASVAAFLQGTDLVNGTTSSTADANGPRTMATVGNQAFATIPGTLAQQEDERYGFPGSSAAPMNAVTVGLVVQALNEAQIEVLGIGLRENFPGGPTKPNQVWPTPPGPPPGQEAAVPAPSEPPTNRAPFTEMSAMALLTGAIEPDGQNLPLVYNLPIVSPPDGFGGSSPTDDVIEDLAKRVGAWLPFFQPQIVNPTGPAGSITADVTLALTPTNVDLVIQNGPEGLLPNAGSGLTQTGVQIPCYYMDAMGNAVDENLNPIAVPDPADVAWTLQVARLDAENTDAESDSMPFSITINPTNVPGQHGAYTPTNVEGSVLVNLPALPTDGTPAANGTAVLGPVTSGCALFKDIQNDGAAPPFDPPVCAP